MVPYRSIFCYAWDIAEVDVSALVDDLKGRHLNTLTLAGSYHAGKFLRPHGRSGRVYFPEDGTAYFKTTSSRYGEIKPLENSLLAERDIFAECCQSAEMDVTAWMVLMHNSRLGLAHPHACVQNAFGDRYIYSLCPSAPAARDYAIAICADVSESYPVSGLTLETPGFLPFVHGYHHEFAMVRQNKWLENLLGLCFCEHCLAGASASGIDAVGLQGRTRAAIDRYLQSDVDYPDDMAAAFWQADTIFDDDLSAFLRWRCRVVERLVADIRAAVRADATVSVIPSVARPTSAAWYEGSDLAGLANVADKLEVCFYEPSPARISSDLFDVTHRLNRTDVLRAVLRPGHPDLKDCESVAAAVATLTSHGVNDISFYSYGHLRTASLDWVGSALAHV